MFITLEEAVDVLKREGVVALPTETVYGLAADATNAVAVQKIFTAKNRPADNPLICHFYNAEQIEHYVEPPPHYVSVLMDEFCPGPLSFLLPLKKDSPLLAATAGQSSVVCRIPQHWLILSLIKQLSVPLAAPSANTSGKVSPTNAQMVEEDLGNKIDGIVDGGECAIGVESTIIDCRYPDHITILRPGVIGKDELLAVLDELNIAINESQNGIEVIPGSKYTHYAPLTPIKRITSLSEIKDDKDIVLLSSYEQLKEVSHFSGTKISLGSTQDTTHAAQQLYHNLKSVDELKAAQAYYLEADWGHSSEGKAIADRLGKVC